MPFESFKRLFMKGKEAVAKGKETMASRSQSQLLDPVCHMEVNSGSSFKTSYAGKDYFFCSEECMKSFKAAPSQYLTQRKIG